MTASQSDVHATHHPHIAPISSDLILTFCSPPPLTSKGVFFTPQFSKRETKKNDRDKDGKCDKEKINKKKGCKGAWRGRTKFELQPTAGVKLTI